MKSGHPTRAALAVALSLAGCKKSAEALKAEAQLKPRVQAAGFYRALDTEDPVQGIWGLLPIATPQADSANAYRIDTDSSGHVKHIEWRTQGVLRENDKDWATVDVNRSGSQETWVFLNLAKKPVNKLVYDLDAKGFRVGLHRFYGESLLEAATYSAWSVDSIGRPTLLKSRLKDGTALDEELYRYPSDSVFVKISYDNRGKVSVIRRTTQTAGRPATWFETLEPRRSDNGSTEEVTSLWKVELDSVLGLKTTAGPVDNKGTFQADATTSWKYDKAGNLVEERTSKGIVRKTWSKGLLTSRLWRTPDNRLVLNQDYDAAVLRMGYDAKGNQTSIEVLGEDSLPHYSSALQAAKILQKFVGDSLTETVRLGTAGDTLR